MTAIFKHYVKILMSLVKVASAVFVIAYVFELG